MQATILRALLWLIKFHLWQMKGQGQEDLTLYRTGQTMVGELKWMVDDEEAARLLADRRRPVRVMTPSTPFGDWPDQAG